jgi:multidrug efflux system membrane fusion protein
MKTRSPTLSSTRHPAILATIPVALMSMLLAGCNDPQAQGNSNPPPTVSVAPVLVRRVTPLGEFNGRIEAIDAVELRPRVSGYIESIDYTEGEEVEKGTVLFTIDDRSYRAELSLAEAELARARTQAALARREADRARTLIEQRAISTEELEQRIAAAERALADVQAAQAAVDQARLNVEWTRVRAPIKGRAGRALVTPGNLVTANDARSVLTTLVSLDKVYVYFDADESTFLRFVGTQRKTTLPVRVGLASDEGYPHLGHMDFLDNQLTRHTGTISARAVLDNSDRRFTPGLYARIQLPVSNEFEAVLVQDRAILTDQDRKYVYVVAEDGSAQRRDVLLGPTAEGLRIVRDGLAPGDRVIVEGVRRVLRPGMPVNAQIVEMSPSGNASTPRVADAQDTPLSPVRASERGKARSGFDM